MFTTTVKYKDFNDVEHTEALYFHLMAPEFADLQFNPTFENGLSEYIKEAMRSGEGAKIYTFFKLMIVNSYGRRSADGSEFIKKAEWTERFLNTRAYEEFFMWLVEDPKNAEKFWNGIIPERIVGKVEEIEKQAKKELKDMTKEELVELMQARLSEKAAPAVTAS